MDGDCLLEAGDEGQGRDDVPENRKDPDCDQALGALIGDGAVGPAVVSQPGRV